MKILLRPCLLLISLLVLGSATLAQVFPSGKLFAFGGLGLTKLVNDSLDLKSSLLPALSVEYNQPVFKDFSVNAGLHYAFAGNKTENSKLRFRNQYAGISIVPQYQLMNFLTMYAGICYNELISQKTGRMDGSSKSGIKWEANSAYGSEFSGMAGVGLQLQKGLWFHVRKQFPANSGDYSSLQFLLSINISDLKFEPRQKKFTTFPEALANYQECRKLVLMRQYMRVLPPEIGKMVNLENLVLDGNELHSLPKEIGNLENLKKLSLKYNYLDSLPIEIGDLVNLEELYLERNNLYELPDEIGRLKALKFLYIGKNNLTELPASIGELTNLIELDVSYSGPMLRIPPELSKLKSLELLIVDRTTQFPVPFDPPNLRFRIVVRY
jgi:hypothetical protein